MEDNPTHVEKLARHDRAVEVHDKRLDAHGAQLDEMRVLLATLTELEKQNAKLIADTQSRLAALEARPARRWDSLATAALTAVAGGLAGWVLAGAGVG